MNNSNNIDLDVILSQNTATYIEKTLYDYKLRILRDLSENINVPMKTLKIQFLKDTSQPKKYHGPDRSEINPDKCMARIWHKTLGGVQCSRSKNGGDYCKTHFNSVKRSYGRIDEPLHS